MSDVTGLAMEKLLHFAFKNEASDLHITTGITPIVRINGKLKRIGVDKLTPDDTLRMAKEITTEDQFQRFLKEGELDFSFSLQGVCRFRVNLYRQRGSVGIVCRVINSEIPTIESLNLPQLQKNLQKIRKEFYLLQDQLGVGNRPH